MRRPIVSKSERSGTGVDMANLSKAVCHGESDKCRFGNPPQESNFQRLGISGRAGVSSLWNTLCRAFDPWKAKGSLNKWPNSRRQDASEGGGGLGDGPPRRATSADRHGAQRQLASQIQAASRENEAARFEREFNFRGRFAINPAKNEVNTEMEIMRISSTNAIEGGRVLYTIGRIEAASAWHPAHGSPLQENWRELVLRELMRQAEDIERARIHP